jgi:hypothetical protein
MRSRPRAASDPRARAAIVLVLSAALGSAARAQAPSEAAQIIEAFGTGGALTQAGMTTYLASVQFRTLDADKSGSLDADEYMTAQLYARLPACGNDRARVHAAGEWRRVTSLREPYLNPTRRRHSA